MATQVEVDAVHPGVVSPRLHLSPLTDSSNKTPTDASSGGPHVMIMGSPEPGKPVPGPKPRLTPKPFTVDRNLTIRPILAPKPNPKPRPEPTRPSGPKLEPPTAPKPASRPGASRPTSTAYKPGSKPSPGSKLGVQSSKPMLAPVPHSGSSEPVKPVPRTSLAPPMTKSKPGVGATSLRPAAEWSGASRPKPAASSITRAKSMGYLPGVGADDEGEGKAEEPKAVIRQTQDSKSSRPRPVSAVFLPTSSGHSETQNPSPVLTPTSTPTPAPRWSARRPLSADLTSRFESIGLSLHRHTNKLDSKENTLEMPASENAGEATKRENVKAEVDDRSKTNKPSVLMEDAEGEEAKHEERAGSSIKRRISLLLDSSSSSPAGAEPRSQAPPISEVDAGGSVGVGVKQRIKELTEDFSATTPTTPQKPQIKPRPLPTDLTKRFSSDVESPSYSEHKGFQEGFEELGRKIEEPSFLEYSKPSEEKKPQEGQELSLPSSSSGTTIQTVRASLFNNVVERHSVQVVEDTNQQGTPVKPMPRRSLSLRTKTVTDSNSGISKAPEDEEEGRLVMATYREPTSPSSPRRVEHVFDTLMTVEGSCAVSESVPSAQLEERALTLRSRRSEAGNVPQQPISQSGVSLGGQIGPVLGSGKEKDSKETGSTRYLRVGALPKWGVTGATDLTGREGESEPGKTRDLVKDMEEEIQRQLEVHKAAKAELEEEEQEIDTEREREREEHQMSRPKATYFALTGQFNEMVHQTQGVPDGRVFRSEEPRLPSSEKVKTDVMFDDFSVKEGRWSSQRRVSSIRRNPSLNTAFRNAEEPQRMEAVDWNRMQEKEKDNQRVTEEELERQRLVEYEKMRELERQREIQKQRDLEMGQKRQKERQRELEREKERQRELERLQELERQKEMERQRELEREKERQRELERQREQERERQRELEKQRENERQKQLEKERQKQIEYERRKAAERELEQQREFERQRQKEFEKEKERMLDQERLRLRECEEQREMEREREQQMELEKQRELERQKRREKERQKEIERQKELERQRELEKRELERQREMENERLRLLEKQKEAERQRELERQKELERQREVERQREMERQKQKELHQHKEMERWKQSEKQKTEERERQRELEDLKKVEELERRQLLEFQMQKESQKLPESPLRPKVLDLDAVSLGDRAGRSSNSSSSDLSPSSRWKQPSSRAIDESYRPSILDIDSFKSQVQPNVALDPFGMTNFVGLDGAKPLTPTTPQLLLQNLQTPALPQYQQPGLTPPQYQQPGLTPPQYQQPGLTPPQYQQPGLAPPQCQPQGLTPPQYQQQGLTPPQYQSPPQFSPQQQPSFQPLPAETGRLQAPLQPQVLHQGFVSERPKPQPQVVAPSQAVNPDWSTGGHQSNLTYPGSQIDVVGRSHTELPFDEPLWVSSVEGSRKPISIRQSSLDELFQQHEERVSDSFLAKASTPSAQASGFAPSMAITVTPTSTLTPERIWTTAGEGGFSGMSGSPVVAVSWKVTSDPVSQGGTTGAGVSGPTWSPNWELASQEPNKTPGRNKGNQETPRMRSRSVGRKSAPVESVVDGLSRLRSRSVHRVEGGRQNWEQVKQTCDGAVESKDTDTLVRKRDSQYGTWETGLCTDESLTPATPSSDGILSPSPRTPTPPLSPEIADAPTSPAPLAEDRPELLPFPETPTTLLDSSALRSRVQLSKKRKSRAPPSRTARHSAALAQLAEGSESGAEDWRYKDSTDSKPDSSQQQDSGSDSEDRPRGGDSRNPPSSSSSSSSQPQRVSLFPGMDPSALMAQLKKRGETESQSDSSNPSASQLSRSPKSPFLPRASRVLPPAAGGKQNGEESSPQWLKELKSKKRLSQYENDS